MRHSWALDDAKERFNEVVKKAQEDGPQFISVYGKEAVVVISQKEYESLTAPALSLVEFFRKSPLVGLDLDWSRDKSLPRDIDS